MREDKKIIVYKYKWKGYGIKPYLFLFYKNSLKIKKENKFKIKIF